MLFLVVIYLLLDYHSFLHLFLLFLLLLLALQLQLLILITVERVLILICVDRDRRVTSWTANLSLHLLSVGARSLPHLWKGPCTILKIRGCLSLSFYFFIGIFRFPV